MKRKNRSRTASKDSTAAGPRQERSRRTQERLLQATERLMTRLGTADFSVPDVSREAGMSIGGIYRRFKDKEALLLAVQERLYESMSADYAAVEAEARRDGDTLQRLVDILVAGLANLLRRHAPMIKAIMEATWTSADIAAGGVRSFQAHSQRFKSQLLVQRRAITHPNPELAAEFCFISVFELLASHFGVGRRAAPEHTPWPVLVAELQRLTYCYLTGGVHAAAARRNPSGVRPRRPRK